MREVDAGDGCVCAGGDVDAGAAEEFGEGIGEVDVLGWVAGGEGGGDLENVFDRGSGEVEEVARLKRWAEWG